MAPRRQPASPVLDVAMSVIGEAGDSLVTSDSRFRHSFEAPLDRIAPDPAQPRKSFAEGEIIALAATMAAEGQLQPVLLRRDPTQRGHWILVAGERRWRAARQNGWSSLLAIEHTGDAELAALLENLQRVDLSPLEEAHGLQRLIGSKRLSQAQAATLLGRSKSEISATLRLLTLPEALLRAGSDLPRNALVELARLDEGAVRDRLLRQAATGQLTVRAIRAARTEPEPALAASAQPPNISATLVERLMTALAQRHDNQKPLTTTERRRLEDLREAISRMLEF